MLILVRHGRTSANAAGLLQGRMNPPLDDVGRQQARCIGEEIRRSHPAPLRVIASPLVRAQETASYLGMEVHTDDRWQEIDYGVYEGRPLADIGASQWARWRSDNEFAVEGGESLAALLERVRPALEEAAEMATDHDVVVVSHVSPIKAAVAWALGVGIEVSWRCQLGQASITKLAMSPRGPSLTLFNDTSHLDR